jgi:hypothetical protein
MAFDIRNGDLYVTDGGLFGLGGGAVTVISGSNNSVITNVRVPGTPFADYYDPLNGDIYVPAANLSVISGATNTLVASIALPGGPNGMPVVDPLNGDLYVGGGTGINIISGTTNQLLQTVALPGGDPLFDQGFVDSHGNICMLQGGEPGNVTVFSGASNEVLSTFPIGDAAGMTYDPVDGTMFSYWIRAPGLVNVTSLASHALLETLDTGTWLTDTPIRYDPGNGELYAVGNSGGTAVAIANESTPGSASASGYSASYLLAAGVLGFAAGLLVVGVVLLHVRRRRRDPFPSLRTSPGVEKR